LILGIANKAMGKHAMATIDITPKRIRYEFVVSFIMHLHFVHEMDDGLIEKVPETINNSTQYLLLNLRPFENPEAWASGFSKFISFQTTCVKAIHPCG
jgi:hypothetical protein